MTSQSSSAAADALFRKKRASRPTTFYKLQPDTLELLADIGEEPYTSWFSVGFQRVRADNELEAASRAGGVSHAYVIELAYESFVGVNDELLSQKERQKAWNEMPPQLRRLCQLGYTDVCIATPAARRARDEEDAQDPDDEDPVRPFLASRYVVSAP